MLIIGQRIVHSKCKFHPCATCRGKEFHQIEAYSLWPRTHKDTHAVSFKCPKKLWSPFWQPHYNHVFSQNVHVSLVASSHEYCKLVHRLPENTTLASITQTGHFGSLSEPFGHKASIWWNSFPSWHSRLVMWIRKCQHRFEQYTGDISILGELCF